MRKTTNKPVEGKTFTSTVAYAVWVHFVVMVLIFQGMALKLHMQICLSTPL